MRSVNEELYAAVLELVDRRVSKTRVPQRTCRFDSDSRHRWVFCATPTPPHMNINQPYDSLETNSPNPSPQPVKKNLDAYQALLQIQNQEENLSQRKSYIKAYTLSILLPPIGLYYFLKFFFLDSEEDEARKAGIISLSLTIISLILNLWLLSFSLNQFKSINPQTQQLLQDLITPSIR